MHTPSEAAGLWCPMVRIGITPEAGGPSAINDPMSPYKGQCIADRCAMWRWVPDSGSEPYDCPQTGAKLHRSFVVRERGYCGLAGAPWAAP